MGDARWQRISRIYHNAEALAASERAAFLDAACAGDDTLRAEIESLLNNNSDVERLLEPKRDRMSLIGQRLGVYELYTLVGAGGMGDVYRARDTRLHRDVAIKVLPAEFAADRDRLARFEREAQLLASLNHQHIATIHGVEDASGAPALVLELVEGETLAERIARGPMPMREALQIARQIAEGLEAAHEHGIIHRDLKPANVKLTPDGTVKILDFGLARMAVAETASNLDATESGMILGTTAYMSPEQARGQRVDNRTDIWSFGCVLYEMLAGRPAFTGDTPSDTLAAVLNGTPDWTELPASTSAFLRRLLEHCLEKDARQRTRQIADVRLAVNDALGERQSETRPRARPRRGRVALQVAAGLVAAAIGLAVFNMFPPFPRARPEPFRFSLETPPMPNPHSIAVSPDGQLIVFTAIPAPNAQPMLFVRRIGSVDTRPVPGTERGLLPFWSPDSRKVGFYDQQASKLKTIDIVSGEARVVCDTSLGFYGGAWHSDDFILFSYAAVAGAQLHRVPAAGGVSVALELPVPVGAQNLRWPQFLPGGRRFLYQAAGPDTAKRAIYVASLDGGNPTRLLFAESNAVFAPPDRLLFTRQRVLVAQRFNPDELTLEGEPTAIASDVFLQANGRAAFAASPAGVLLYRAGGFDRSLVWVDRSGRPGEPVGALSAREHIRVSPDGNHVTFHEPRDPAAGDDIFVYDIARKNTTRVTSEPGLDYRPIWSPDGTAIAFSSHKSDRALLHEADASGAKPKILRATSEPYTGYEALTWTAEFFVYCRRRLENGMSEKWYPGTTICNEVWYQRTSGDRATELYFPDWRGGNAAALSPNGRWLAYVANEAGTRQVIVQSFPNRLEERHVISSKGGTEPRWSRDGRELYYLGPGQQLTAVTVDAGRKFVVLKTDELFTAPSSIYDVGPDGRFLFNVASTSVGAAMPITVVLNWMAAIKK